MAVQRARLDEFDGSPRSKLMTPRERWDELEALFNEARQLPPNERESLLAPHSLDTELRRQIDELLRAHDALEMSDENSFLVSLDTGRASSLLDVAAADDAQTAPLSPGETVGRYRIVRPIGRGGMGVIYLALDPRLNRSVALKLLPPHLSVDSSARRRFEEEARAASLLDHPHIATVYEVDETSDGRLFIAMAYYEGETLREKIERGPLAITDVVSFAMQVADGLKAAHAAGLVHRDIKPGNIIVTQQNVAKIVDFGIARIATDEVTHASATAGTVAYMSPEQTRGAPPNPRMDVWSFGVILYELVAGVRPFFGDRDEVVIFAIRNDDPESPEHLRGEDVPAELLQIMERCLQKNPAARYSDGGGIVTDLLKLRGSERDPDSFDSSRAINARVEPAKRNRWRSGRYVVAAIATLAILSTGAVWIRNNQVAARRSATVTQSIALSSRARDSNLVGSLTADPEAYDLYLRGRYLRTRPTKDRLEQAVVYFRGATERDPNFAEAYSGLAETYVNLANFGYITATEGFEAANIAAERALKLNPRLAEAYTSHGYVLASRRVFDSAEVSFRRALDLNPNFALGHHYYSLLLAMLDRTDEALEQNRRAREIDPLFTPAVANYGIILWQRGELHAADTALRKALVLEPNFALTLYWLGAVLAAEGNYSESRQFLERAARASRDFPGVLGALAYIDAHEGRLDAADSIVATLKARATDNRSRTNLAFAYAALGKRDSAFMLMRDLEWDLPSGIGLRADPLLQSLRSDPRYAVLLRDIVRPTGQAKGR